VGESTFALRASADGEGVAARPAKPWRSRKPLPIWGHFIAQTGEKWAIMIGMVSFWAVLGAIWAPRSQQYQQKTHKTRKRIEIL
jgi:hypothetical protein